MEGPYACILQTELHPHLSNRTVLRLELPKKKEREKRKGRWDREQERGKKGVEGGEAGSGKREATSHGETQEEGEVQRALQKTSGL